MSYKSLYVVCLLVFYIIGCSTDSTDDSIFPVPPTIDEADDNQNNNASADPPAPIIEPEMVQQDNKNLTAPKLLESTVDSGGVDPNTNVISLRFNENITEIDIKLVDDSDVSMEWIPSVDTITGRRIFLTKFKGRKIHSDRKYYIKGFVENKHGNRTSIDIEFRGEVEENRDRTPPVILNTSIGHGATNVNINTDQIVFTFNENIGRAEARLVRGANWQTGPDMRWTRFIDEKTVVLVKITGKSLSLRNNQVYHIVLQASDESGNWTPDGGRVWLL